MRNIGEFYLFFAVTSMHGFNIFLHVYVMPIVLLYNVLSFVVVQAEKMPDEYLRYAFATLH